MAESKLLQYKEIRQLGKGSFGKALLVTSISTNKQFVMKIINISQMKQKEREESLREVEVMRQLNHPNVVKYFDAFIENRQLFIIMEYANGGDIQQLINDQKKLGKYFLEDQVLFYFVQILLALKHIHDRRILHRDLKGPNIFLHKVVTVDNKTRYQVKLGDFGVAKILSNTIECANTVIGTPYYLSPEICNNTGYNNKSDIWALGCILYELCTLQHVFDASNLKMLVVKILEGKYSPISNKQYSKNLSDLVNLMLQKDASKRPQINQILQMDFIKTWIPKLLPPDVIKREFPVKVQAQQQAGTNNQNIKVEIHVEEQNIDQDFGDSVQDTGINQAIGQFQQQINKMNQNASATFRIEKYRCFLEQQLSFDVFFTVYQLINQQYEQQGQKAEVNTEEIVKIISAQNLGLLNLVIQLIYLEQQE